jgi:hypothetical protein
MAVGMCGGGKKESGEMAMVVVMCGGDGKSRAELAMEVGRE